MKIPNNSGLVPQLDMVCGSIPVKCSLPLKVQIQRDFVCVVFIVVRSEAEAYQSELDELKTVRYWVRKVIPDALPTPTESSKPSHYDTMDTTQNEKERSDLLNRTTKQTIVPQHDKTQTITHPHCKETR